MSPDEDPFGISRHLGYSRDRVSRIRGGSKLDGDPDYRAEEDVRDKSTLYFLYNTVDELGFKKIVNVASSKEAWEILEVAYTGNNRVRQVRLQALRGEFQDLKMEDKEQVSEYIT